MAYAGDLKSPGRKAVWVRLPPRVPHSEGEFRVEIKEKRGTQAQRAADVQLQSAAGVIMIVVAARIVVPVVVVMPSVVPIVPPLMVFMPAMLAFGAKLVPSSVGLRTVLAVALNSAVELGPRVFNAVLAL